MVISCYALLIGYGIDLLLGDPHSLPHPVVWIGKLISVCERCLRRVFPHTRQGELAAGVALATIPWAIYFGVNGAVGPWLKTYLYDNLFLYQDEEALSMIARVKAMLRAGLDWFTANWPYTVPMALGSAAASTATPTSVLPVEVVVRALLAADQ